MINNKLQLPTYFVLHGEFPFTFYIDHVINSVPEFVRIDFLGMHVWENFDLKKKIRASLKSSLFSP